MRYFICFLAIPLILSCNKIEQDNIIIVFADDMGYGDPACYNPDSKILTPGIDELAAEGMMFTNAHAPASWCTPSRYGLMTGKYPARTNIGLAGKKCLIEPGQTNLASLLKEKGYYTACIGKWHLGFDSVNFETGISGGPVDRGFDYYFGIPVSLDIPPYYYIENKHCVAPPTDTIEASNTPGMSVVQGVFWRKGGIAPGFSHIEVLPKLTLKALEVIENHHNSDHPGPFFLYFPMPGPHTPWVPTEEYEGQSEAGMYGDFVMQVDDVLGRIMAKLESLGIEDNTMVVFTSDNGPVWFEEDINLYKHNSSAYLKGIKSDMWEGGHRMPFIVKWPKYTPGNTKNNELICFTDLLATFAEIAGNPIDSKEFDSRSILPLLTGLEYSSPLRNNLIIDTKVLLTNEWKFIDGHGGDGFNRAYSLSKERFQNLPRNEGELYHIASDSTERINLFYERPEVADSLRRELISILQNKNQD